MGIFNSSQVKMLRLVVFVAVATLVSGQAKNATGSNPNTRLFGLDGLIGGAVGALGGALAGVNQAFNQPQRPGQQFPGQQGGFVPQPIVPTGNIPVGGAIVNQGAADNRPVVQGVSNSCRRWCRKETLNQFGAPFIQEFCCEF